MEGHAPTYLTSVDAERIRRLRDVGDFFWVDLIAPPPEALAELGELLDLHPLAIEDSQKFGQRAKLEEYEGFLFLVVYGAAPGDDPDRLVEAHCFYGESFLVTVREDRSAELDRLHAIGPDQALSGLPLLHRVLDVLVDSLFPLADEVDGQLQAIEDRIYRREPAGCEDMLHAANQAIAHLSRAATPQREMFSRLNERLLSTPRHAESTMPYFRDVSDHVIRLSEQLETSKSRATGVMQLHLAVIADRQNQIMKQFTVIASIFLPLTFLVGLFGQNFRWMTDRVEGAAAFWLLGVAMPVGLGVVLLAVLIRRRLL